MDYQTQQYKLLPLLSSSYALQLTGMAMMIMYLQVRGEISEGNLESLPEVTLQLGLHHAWSTPSFLPPSLSPASCHKCWAKGIVNRNCQQGHRG